MRPPQRVPDGVVQAIEELRVRMDGADVNWLVSGSAAIALQGVPVDGIDDIDVETDADGAYAMEASFAELVVHPVTFSSAGSVRSHFGALELHGLRVEIIGGLQIRGRDGSWGAPYAAGAGKVQVSFGGGPLPVISLTAALEQYRRLNRPERVALLASCGQPKG